jgi:hypothetical protein
VSGAFVALKPVLMSKVSELLQSEAILKLLPGLWKQSPICFSPICCSRQCSKCLALSSNIFLQREAGVVNRHENFGLGIRPIDGFPRELCSADKLATAEAMAIGVCIVTCMCWLGKSPLAPPPLPFDGDFSRGQNGILNSRDKRISLSQRE